MRFTKTGSAMLGGLLGALAIFILFVANNPVGKETPANRQILTYSEGSPDTITGEPPQPGEPPPPVYVMKDGNVFLGDRPISREEFETMLDRAKAEGHVVTFARDSVGDGSSDIQQEVFGLVQRSGARYQLRKVPRPAGAPPENEEPAPAPVSSGEPVEDTSDEEPAAESAPSTDGADESGATSDEQPASSPSS